MRRSLVALPLVAGLLVAACSSAAAPTPPIVYVTPEPTIAESPRATPTPEPTPIPPPTPTPTPTVNPGAAKFDAFVERASKAGGALVDISAKICTTCLDKDDDEAFSASLEPLADWANAEVAWLVAFPPDDCYRSTYDTWKRGPEAMQSAVSAMQRGARNHNDDLLQQGIGLLSQANAFMKEANNTFPASMSACR